MNTPGSDGREDDELVRIVRADPDGRSGREAASELLGRHQRRVYLWCLRIVRDPERALELSQETLLNAWRALPRFEGRSKFSSWLFVIARNRCFNAIASPSLLRDEDTDPDATAAADGDPAARWQEHREESEVIELLEQHLDVQERTALWMRCFERLAVDDITVALQLESATGARALLQRARRKLRAALEDRANEGDRP